MAPLIGTVAGLYIGRPNHIGSEPTDQIELTYDGVKGDRHTSRNRRSGIREASLYPRGTMIQNQRQISIVSDEELACIAAALDIAELRPEWLGANLAVNDLPCLSQSRGLSRLRFSEDNSGPTILISGRNTPCADAAREIARHEPSVTPGAFVKAALHLRGLVGWIEYPGHPGCNTIRVGQPCAYLEPLATA